MYKRQEILGCKEGRFTETWYDFDLFGNQMSAHISNHIPSLDYCGHVDGIKVPIPHFGCLLTLEQFDDVQQRLEKANIEFVVKPNIRYEGMTGEQKTMFVLDYSGNPIEFKAFKDQEEIFKN